MLLDGTPFATIIEATGDHGKGISEANIGNWKKGGFQDWLQEQQRNQTLALRRDSALALLDEKAGVTVQDAGRTVAAAQLYELLLSFDPSAFAESLVEKPELYLRLIAVLARLSEGEAACAHHRVKESILQAKIQTEATGEPANVISDEALKAVLRRIKLL
jgi:hypothetical protein